MSRILRDHIQTLNSSVAICLGDVSQEGTRLIEKPILPWSPDIVG